MDEVPPLRPEGRLRWHLNRWLLRHLHWLRPGTWVTVRDEFGAPGDTLLTAIVCRHIAQRFPRLRINCITPNSALLIHDPHIHRLNGPETFVSLRHWYLGLLHHKNGEINVLSESMQLLGFANFDYRAEVYLTDAERDDARARLGENSKALLTLNTRSKEPVKTWPAERWRQLAALLARDFDLVQLGDATELQLDGVRSFGGKLSMRESMAVLSHARLHVGPDSFLMHAANGLRVPSVILFGGSRTARNLGYTGNVNLYIPMPCGPCYIHAALGETCAHQVECMDRITVEQVHAAVLQQAGHAN